MSDLYRELAAAMFNTTERKITPDQRKLAKSATYGAIYSNYQGTTEFLSSVSVLVSRRRRARRTQRWAIALLVIAAVLLLALEAWNAR